MIGNWSLSNFLDLLYSVSTNGQGEDQMCWKPSGSRTFQVRSYYLFLIGNKNFINEAKNQLSA